MFLEMIEAKMHDTDDSSPVSNLETCHSVWSMGHQHLYHLGA